MWLTLLCVSTTTNHVIRGLLKESSCCPRKPNFDPCCNFEFKGAFYFGRRVARYFTDHCCHSGVCEIEECSECNEYPLICTESLNETFYNVGIRDGAILIEPYLPYIESARRYVFHRESNVDIRLENGEFFDGLVPLNEKGSLSFYHPDAKQVVKVEIVKRSPHACASFVVEKREDSVELHINLSDGFRKLSAFEFVYNGTLTDLTIEPSPEYQRHFPGKVVAVYNERHPILPPATVRAITHDPFALGTYIVATETFPVVQYTHCV